MVESKTIQIIISLNGKPFSAMLTDSPTTQDFIKLLPLSLDLEDFANSEKIASLTKKLSTEGAPQGYGGVPGDITYYAPWGNLAFFYGTGPKNACGLIFLGKFDKNNAHASTLAILETAKHIQITTA